MKLTMIPMVFVFGVVALLNFLPGSGGLAFGGDFYTEGFGASRGWPFKAFAPANDVGDHLARASVIQGNTVVYRNALYNPRYPHLAVNWFFAATDLVIAAFLILMSWFLPRLFRRGPVEAPAAGR